MYSERDECCHVDSEHEVDDEATCTVSVMNVAKRIVSTISRSCLGGYYQGCQFGNLVAKIGSFGTFSCCLATKNSDLATV